MISNLPGSFIEHLTQIRVLLGDKILDAYKKIKPTMDEVRLRSAELIMETPRKAGLGWTSELNKYTNNKGVNMIRLPLRFLKINEDIAIWSAPIELFCEVANEIRDRSPFPYTLFFGYSNGWLSYLPTASAWEHGGYETSVSPFTPSAATEIKQSVLGYLHGEMKSIPGKSKDSHN